MSSLFERMKQKNQKEDAKVEEEVKILPPEADLVKTPEPTPLAAETPAAEPAKTAKPAKAEKAEKAPKSVAASVPKGLTLYVNCIPVTEGSTYFEQILAKARQMILASHGLADYRFAEFGQGPGILIGTVQQILDETPLLESLVVDTSQPESQVCLATLRSRAAKIVVGLR